MSGPRRCEQCIKGKRTLAYCLQQHPHVKRISMREYKRASLCEREYKIACKDEHKPPNAAALHMRMVRALAKDQAQQQQQEERHRWIEQHMFVDQENKVEENEVDRGHTLDVLACGELAAEQDAALRKRREKAEQARFVQEKNKQRQNRGCALHVLACGQKAAKQDAALRKRKEQAKRISPAAANARPWKNVFSVFKWHSVRSWQRARRTCPVVCSVPSASSAPLAEPRRVSPLSRGQKMVQLAHASNDGDLPQVRMIPWTMRTASEGTKYPHTVQHTQTRAAKSVGTGDLHVVGRQLSCNTSAQGKIAREHPENPPICRHMHCKATQIVYNEPHPAAGWCKDCCQVLHMGFDYKPHVVDPCIWATVQPTNIRESISRALNRLQAEQFEVHEVCGQGAYGVVVKCYDRVGGQMVAVKIFNSKSSARESCRREWTALTSASAEDLDSVAKLVCCPPLAPAGLITMDVDNLGSDVHGICMQHFATDTSVEAFYQKEFATPDHVVGPAPPLVHAYMRELFKGIQCLGRAGLVHLDIKPGNFLFHVEDQKGCLVDLGLAVKKGRAGFSNIYQVGTPGFRAPELARQPSHKWTLSEPDIWSAGVVLLQLLRGSTDPNTGLEATLYDESLRQNYTKDALSSWRSKWPRPDGSEIETPDQDPVWRLLNLTLQVEPAKRLTAQKALTLLDRTATEWDVAHTSQHQTVSQT
jgi:hypothetical protein